MFDRNGDRGEDMSPINNAFYIDQTFECCSFCIHSLAVDTESTYLAVFQKYNSCL